MTKIAHLTTVDLSLRYLLLNQLVFLREEGYDVYGISSPGSQIPEIEKAGIQHLPVPISRKLLSPWRDLISFVKLIGLLRREQFDILHVHTPKASFLGQIAGRIVGVPIIIRTLHGFYFHEGTHPVLRRMMILLERFASRYVDAILSQNSEDIQTAAQERICPPEKISFLGNGIDLVRFDPKVQDPREIERMRTDLGLEQGKKVIGFVGRLVAEKGVPELLEAIQLLRNKRDDFILLLVGPVDREKKDAITPDLAQEIGIAEICSFAGFQQDMPLVYSLMDIFVLPSHREGFPRSLMEACAMGLPCIATDIRGCREVIQPGENGLLVPVNDSQALAVSLETLLDEPDLTKRMGESGKNIAAERFNEKRVFEIVLQTYKDQLH